MHEPLWYITKDGDRSCLALYRRHYSALRNPAKRKVAQFVGPGEHIVLRTGDADALFVWRKFIDDSGQQGVSCAVFRNESPHLSSELIRQADAVADFVWPGERHYTFVNPKAVRSRNPGYCFVAAGWRRCGFTKGGLIVLERTFAWLIENAQSLAHAPLFLSASQFYRSSPELEWCADSRMALGFKTEDEARDFWERIIGHPLSDVRILAHAWSDALKQPYSPAQGIEAPSGGETALAVSPEGESPVAEGDAP